MEPNKLKRLLALALIVAIGGVTSMCVMGRTHDSLVAIRQEKENLEEMDGLELLQYYTNEIKKNKEVSEFDQQLRMELPKGVSSDDVTCECDYMNRVVEIKIPTTDKDYFYHYPMLGKCDYIEDMNLSVEDGYAELTVSLNSVYEVETDVKEGHEEYIYIDFVKPSEIYDKIVVVDAGHGGSDSGAERSGVNEKDINLGIVKQLKKLADDQDDIKFYYTRTTDENLGLDERVDLANGVEADYFISVHNNAYSYASAESVNGTEVLYNDQYDEDGVNTSKKLAQLCLDELTSKLGSQNQGLEEGSNIYIVKNSDCPVALVEVGYMSNDSELNHLQDESYQKKAASAIFNAIQEAYEKEL
ncbi:MAG: N-acetylmuramoyl-L-alanine amidase [Eubacterium sp.]|nr:N-acetylmuramoyl-L-alanine amidase [Eubacterium sp.]